MNLIEVYKNTTVPVTKITIGMLLLVGTRVVTDRLHPDKEGERATVRTIMECSQTHIESCGKRNCCKACMILISDTSDYAIYSCIYELFTLDGRRIVSNSEPYDRKNTV